MKGKKILIPVLLLITLIAIGVTIWALCFRDTAPVLAPDYAPVEEESNAQPIEDDSDEKLETEEGGGAASLTYSNEVTIDLSDKAASLVFANPGKSLQDMVVQIVIDDTVIVQSGTLKPGNQVTTLNLLDGAEKQVLNNEKLQAYNQALKEFCTQRGFDFLDIGSALALPDGSLRPEFCSDGFIHETYDAYKVWTKLLLEYAAEKLNESAKIS